jgi:geranylgeranyl pyrophosphate synthase
MNDKEFFYSLYKDCATSFQEELKTSTTDFLDTFPENDPMREITIGFVRDGGKRLRTVLARVVTRCYGREETEATSTLDTFHKFLLCHDDIIDRDSLRWGMPTAHNALEKVIPNAQDSSHIGNSLGIISGDLISSMAYRLTLDSSLEDRVKISLLKLICRAMDEVAWGWYDQFKMDYEPLNSVELSEERIKESIVWVTGKYTISFPIRFGFTIVDEKMPDSLEEIANQIGVLFQTGDDLIGVFGDTDKSGKSNFGDIVQGKKTLPLWFVYQRSNSDQKVRLTELVGKKDITEYEVDEVRNLFRETGAYDYTIEYMRDINKNVSQRLSNVEMPNDLRRFLRGFCEYLLDRES